MLGTVVCAAVVFLQIDVHVLTLFVFHFVSSPVVVIHWTRQIKEVLTSQEAMESSDSSGPLEEIEFWRARCEDLSGLTTQLDQPGVLKVVKIIQKAKSSYLAPFQRLSRQIQVSTVAVSIHTMYTVWSHPAGTIRYRPNHTHNTHVHVHCMCTCT